ncbi:hypothetical protein SH668x_001505 [Planctomicrobium sp. SH668]|uniref:hypothetical protein n=1 Tax=Planctomicrobium sp. SH668 TaxID=3448126 RepID=UPI003F5B5335
MDVSGHNPFDTPRPRGVRLIQLALRAVVAVQCLGIAATYIHRGHPDLLCDLIAQSYPVSEAKAKYLAGFIAHGMIGCALVTLARPINMMLMLLFLYQLGVSIAAAITQIGPLPVLEPALQATRIAAPLALLMIDFWPPRMKASLPICLAATTLMRLSIGISLISHGYLLLVQYHEGGDFLDATQKAVELLFLSDDSASLSLARTTLCLFGAITFSFGVTTILSRSKVTLLMSTLIGLILALSSFATEGLEGYALLFKNVSLPGAPATVLLFLILAVKERKPEYKAEKRREQWPTRELRRESH